MKSCVRNPPGGLMNKNSFIIIFCLLITLFISFNMVPIIQTQDSTANTSAKDDVHSNNIENIIITSSSDDGTLTDKYLSSNTYSSWSEHDKNNNKIHDSLETAAVAKNGLYIRYNRPTNGHDVIALQKLGVGVVYKCKYINMIEIATVPPEIIRKIVNLPGVIFVEPSAELKPMLDISARAIKARESAEYSPNTAWELGFTGRGINIAIFDSGADDNHPSLENKFIAGVDFSNTGGMVTPKDGSFNPDDNDGHGTSVAGIALGTGNPDERYRGIAPDAGLVEVKVTSRLGGRFADALEWCIDNRDTDWNNDNIDENDGIDVLSISLGLAEDNSDGSDSMSQLVNRVVDSGIVVVVAAGNAGPDNEGFNAIAAADKVITVGNLDTQGTIFRNDDVIDTTSNTGPRMDDGDTDQFDEMKPEVVAPGTNVMAPTFSPIGQGNINNGYNTFGGTSAACPHVAGICALMLNANPDLRPRDIKKILHATAEAMGNPDLPELSNKYNYTYGYGSVDAYEAVNTALSYIPTNSAPIITSITASPMFVEPNGQVDITTKASDPDGDGITYNYTASGGSIEGSGAEVIWNAPTELGQYEITVVVNDGELSSDPASVMVTVETEPGNHAPEIERMVAKPVEVGPGGSSNITVSATDPDGDELFYEYTATGGKIIGSGSQVVWTAPNAVGTYQVTVSVNDGELSAESRVTIEVVGEPENKPPDIESFTASANRVPVSGSVILQVKAVDPEMGPLEYSYVVFTGKIKGSGSMVTWTAPDKPGNYVIETTVTDNMGFTDTEDIMLEVYQPNVAPEIEEKNAFPNNAKNDGSVEALFTIKVTDKNGLDDISKVVIDLTALFGTENQKMNDNGKFGDQTKADGVYSVSFLIPEGVTEGRKPLPVSVQDLSGETASDTIYIAVIQAEDDETDKGILEEYLSLPGFEGEILVFAIMLIIFILSRNRIKIKKMI